MKRTRSQSLSYICSVIWGNKREHSFIKYFWYWRITRIVDNCVTSTVWINVVKIFPISPGYRFFLPPPVDFPTPLHPASRHAITWSSGPDEIEEKDSEGQELTPCGGKREHLSSGRKRRAPDGSFQWKICSEDLHSLQIFGFEECKALVKCQFLEISDHNMGK